MKTRYVDWAGRNVIVEHEEPRYFVTITFVEIDNSGMGIFLVPSEEEKRAFILDNPKLSTSRAWKRTYDMAWMKMKQRK